MGALCLDQGTGDYRGKAGAELMEMTRPFVFAVMSIIPPFAAMREMKAMIEREVMRRNIEDDIKLGAGGIREINLSFKVLNHLWRPRNVSCRTVNVWSIYIISVRLNYWISRR